MVLASSACVVAATVSEALAVAPAAVGQVPSQSVEVAVPWLVPEVLWEVPVEPVVPLGASLVVAQSHGALPLGDAVVDGLLVGEVGPDVSGGLVAVVAGLEVVDVVGG